MFYIHNISEIKELGINDDGTIRVSLVIDVRDYENNEEFKALMVLPRFVCEDGELSMLVSQDNELFNINSIKIDPLIGVE